MTTANERLIKILKGERVDRPACICPGGMMNMVTKELQDVAGVYLPEAHTDARMMADLAKAIVDQGCFENYGVPFCMFPEGRHRPMHSLLPLQKGIARIAFASASERPTCIVPVGIEYDDFFHYRSTCTIRFGEPLDVNGFLAGHPDLGEAELSRKLLEELSGRMKELFLCLPDDPSYRARLREVRPPRTRKSVILRRLSALVLLPLFLLSAVLSFPLWPIAEGICRFYLADKAFGNTVRYMCRLLGMPLMLVVWTVLALCFLPAAVAWAVPVLFLFSYSFFYDWLNLWRK